MKIILIIAFCCLLHLSSSQPQQQCCVDFYEHDNYQGQHASFCSAGNYSVGDMLTFQSWNWNDKISSFKVGSGCLSITFYRDINWAGDQFFWAGPINVPSLQGSSWNDQISSFIAIILT